MTVDPAGDFIIIKARLYGPRGYWPARLPAHRHRQRGALCSACHGAGRSLSRGKSRHVDEATYTDTFSRLRVVTPSDPNAADVRLRRDVLAQYHDRLKEEAPYAYKDITPVVQTVEDADVARRVARMWPLLTIKAKAKIVDRRMPRCSAPVASSWHRPRYGRTRAVGS